MARGQFGSAQSPASLISLPLTWACRRRATSSAAKALNPSSLPTYLLYWGSTCAAVRYSAAQRSAVQGASPGGDGAYLAVAPYRGQTSPRLCNRAGINHQTTETQSPERLQQ